MKIVTSLIHRHGKKVSYGKNIVEFDTTGVAEVTQEVAEQVISTDTSLSIFDEKENDNIDLNTMTVKELQSIATEANLPASEWQTLKKVDLIKYLESKTAE